MHVNKQLEAVGTSKLTNHRAFIIAYVHSYKQYYAMLDRPPQTGCLVWSRLRIIVDSNS